MLQEKCLTNKKQLVNKFIRVNGMPAKILGMGKQSLKLGFPQPKGFSLTKEMNSGFVKWTSVTPELKAELEKLLPKPQGQQTLF